ncbi:MAG: hypothetical protein ABIA63_13425 [bacterium]
MAKKDIVEKIRTIESDCENYFDIWRLIWDQNILKYKGQHWLELNLESREWQSSKHNYQDIDQRYPTPTTNIVGDKVKTIKSDTVRTFPFPYAKNRIKSELAKRAANFADISIKHYLKKPYKKNTANRVNWCLITGGCIIIPYWNLNTGKYLQQEKTKIEKTEEIIDIKICADCETVNPPEAVNCQNPQCNGMNLIPEKIPMPVEKEVPVLDKDGNPKMETIPLGDPAHKITSYYEWLFDPFAEEIEDCSWIIRRRLETVKWVKDQFPEKADEVETDSSVCDKYWHIHRFNSWVSGTVQLDYDASSYLKNFMEDTIDITEYWELPVGLKDKGQHVMLAGKVKLKDEDFPWEDRKWHFIHDRYDKDPGTFYGKSLVGTIAPKNDIVNRTDQQILWNQQMLIDPIIINPQGSQVEDTSFYGDLGRIIRPVPGAEPSIMQGGGTGLPVQVYENRKIHVEDIDRLSVSDPMGGNLPGGRTPAASIELMLERSSAKLSDFTIILADNTELLCWEYIMLIRDNMKDERKRSIFGEEDEYEIEAFNGEMLKGDPDFEDGGILIEINPDGLYPTSKAADKQHFMELLQYQAVNPQDPFVKSKMFKLFGLDREGLNESFNLDVSAARRENLEMERGMNVIMKNAKYNNPNMVSGMQPQQIQQMLQQDPTIGLLPGENKAIHAEIHRQDIQKEKFNELDPKVQQMKLMHYQMTTMALQADQMRQMEMKAVMAQATRGAPAQ